MLPLLFYERNHYGTRQNFHEGRQGYWLSAPVIVGTAVPDGRLRDLDHAGIPENMPFDLPNEYSQWLLFVYMTTTVFDKGFRPSHRANTGLRSLVRETQK